MSKYKFLIEVEVVGGYLNASVVENPKNILETIIERLEGCSVRTRGKGENAIRRIARSFKELPYLSA